MHRHRLAVIGVIAVAIALVVATVGRGNGNGASSIPLAPPFNAADLYAPGGDDWITNGGGTTNDRYSTLSEINTSNVGKLKPAWKIHLKSGGTRAYSQEATPVVYKASCTSRQETTTSSRSTQPPASSSGSTTRTFR